MPQKNFSLSPKPNVLLVAAPAHLVTTATDRTASNASLAPSPIQHLTAHACPVNLGTTLKCQGRRRVRRVKLATIRTALEARIATSARKELSQSKIES